MRGCVYRECVALALLCLTADVARSQLAWFVDNNEGSSCNSPRGLTGFCRQRDNCLVRASDPPPASSDNNGRALCGSLGPGALVCCEVMRNDVISSSTTASSTEEPMVSPTEEPVTSTTTVEPLRRPVGERSSSYCLANITFRKQPWWTNQEYRLEKKRVQPWWRQERQEESGVSWWQGERRVPGDGNNLVNSAFQVYNREFPHMALLGYLAPGAVEVSWHCSGSLISDRFVLTAAHCFKDSRLKAPVLVRLGEHDLSRSERTERDYGIERTWFHPQEEPDSWYHDLALIKLNRAVKFTRNISPACLSNRPEGLEVEEGLVVTGWGSSAQDTPSQLLLKGSGPLNVLPRNECASYYQLSADMLPNGIQPGLLCAADFVGDVNTCQGDSGGPLQLKTQFDAYVIVGVATPSVRFCGVRTPIIYTRVSFYLDWIEDIVWPEPTPETETESRPLDV